MLSAGDRVGVYEILGPLGSGGMGHLYRARDTRLGRHVAIKVLSERLSSKPESLLRFEQEARAASALNHPHIVTIYEIDEIDGSPFIAMELIEGRSLRDVIIEESLSIRRAVSIAAQVAHGLGAAHDKGIVHRDLKPENVMITREGYAKILDFGLAKLAYEAPSPEDVTADKALATEPGRILGTVGYLSPEQARGLPLDHRSDQFAFGCILYEMLTGKRPFRGKTPLDTLSAIIHDEPEDLTQVNPRVPGPLDWLVKRCLRKEAEERFDSTMDLARELDTIRDHMTQSTSGISWPTIPSRRNLRWLTVASIFAIAITVASFLALRAQHFVDEGESSRPGVETRTRTQHAERARMNLTHVAVLPFRDLSGRKNGGLVGEGFAETVGARLSGTAGLAVLPMNALGVDVQDDARVAASDVGADVVLRGSLQFESDRVRATWTLLDDAGVQIAGGIAEGSAARILELQDQIADGAFRALGVEGRTASASEIAATASEGPAQPSGSGPSSSHAPAPSSAHTTGAVPASATGSGFSQDRYLEALGYLRRYDNEPSVDAAIGILEEMGRGNAIVQSALAEAYLAKYQIRQDRSWAERAIAANERAVAIDPDLYEVHETMGRIQLLVDDPKVALEEFRTALALRPDSVEAQMGLASALDKVGDDAGAEAAYRKATEIQPGWWSTWSHLGVFQVTHGEYDEAAAAFEEALKRSPDNVRTLDNLAVTYQMMGKYDEAVARYEKAIAVRPESDTLSNLGFCLYLMGRFDDAARSFERAIRLNPGDATLWFNLADTVRWTRDGGPRAAEAYRKAIEMLEKDLAVTPRDANRQMILALAYAHSKHPEKAKEHMRLALEIDPTNIYVQFRAALVETAAGHRDAAFDHLERAVAGGYSRAEVSMDPYLADLKTDPRFREIVRSKS